MRPIDADALCRHLSDWQYGAMTDGKHDTEYGIIENVIEDIQNAPTVDVMPVRRGKWIDETFKPWGLVHHPYKCDQCGEHSEATSDFCPWCGAKMEANYETD